MGTVLTELRANVACLRESLWTQTQDMEGDLMKDPLPPTLAITLCKSESIWREIEQCYGNILAIDPGDPVQGEIVELRALYLDLSDRIQIAIEESQAEEDARLLQQDRAFKAHVV